MNISINTQTNVTSIILFIDELFDGIVLISIPSTTESHNEGQFYGTLGPTIIKNKAFYAERLIEERYSKCYQTLPATVIVYID